MMTKRLTFTVDSRLLEELGERLVGKPSTALAELVKNSYDADATLVDIVLDRTGEGELKIVDNGHGMTFMEFRDYWMRIGSQHKRTERRSRNFGRPFTGSKGVGRIAAQLLSNELLLSSVSDREPARRLIAYLDWREAIDTGDLVNVEVEVREEELSSPSEPGTTLVLRDLRQDWTEVEVENLAQEIWQLQPPFGEVVSRERATAKDFNIRFGGPEDDLVETFDDQMQAILHLWSAKAVGENTGGRARVSLEFKGESPEVYEYQIDNSELENGRFELRFYDLAGRQPHGIRVGEAREYLQEFGGVHIYDSGFRLPFYGEKDNDWLLISHDTSRRKTLSDLLPSEMQVRRGMLSLPRWHQVLGMVEINTSDEPELEITITRDRLVESKAFKQLRDFVRRAIHWYANDKARRRLEEETREGEDREPRSRIEQVTQFIEENRSDIREEVADRLLELVTEAKTDIEEQEASAERRIGALSSFATAGISAVGYQHELNKQLIAIEELTEELGNLLNNPNASRDGLMTIREDLLRWVDRARKTGRIFSHLYDPENIETERRYTVKALIAEVVSQLEPIRREAAVDLSDVDEDVRLPRGSYTEWVSVFQNIFFNALNAMIDSETREISVSSDSDNSNRRVIVEDTGVGIDLSDLEMLFEPFERKIPITKERKELGFGGTGLGLTIIRMICRDRGVDVGFEEASEGYSTALVLEWDEERT